MITIKTTFQSNGQSVKRTAIVSDDLQTLSNSQKNQAFDIFRESYSDGYWSLFFEGDPGIQYEIEFLYDKENRQFTLKPIKAVTWENDIITDAQTVTVTVR